LLWIVTGSCGTRPLWHQCESCRTKKAELLECGPACPPSDGSEVRLYCCDQFWKVRFSQFFPRRSLKPGSNDVFRSSNLTRQVDLSHTFAKPDAFDLPQQMLKLRPSLLRASDRAQVSVEQPQTRISCIFWNTFATLQAVKFLAILVIALLLPSPAIRAQDISNPAGFRLAQASESRQVWVNTATGIYHYPGTRWYGNTKQGKFMSEKDARARGYRAARNGQ